MNNTGPITSETSKKKVVSAHEVLQEVMSTGSGSIKDDAGSEAGSLNSQKVGSQQQGEEEEEQDPTKVSVKTIKRVLELICDESVSSYSFKFNTIWDFLNN